MTSDEPAALVGPAADAHAAPLCDRLRADFLDRSGQDRSMDESLAASTIVLAAFGRH